MIQAAILAGGKGTRLASVSGGLPKPLVPVGGIPIVERHIALLTNYGVQEIFLTTGYGGGHHCRTPRRWVSPGGETASCSRKAATGYCWWHSIAAKSGLVTTFLSFTEMFWSTWIWNDSSISTVMFLQLQPW